MTRVPLRRGAALTSLMLGLAGGQGATAQTADGGLQPREIAARAQASLLVVRAIGAAGDTVGEGTGFVVGPDGTFVTNYHVVEPASRVEVQPLEGGATRTVLLVAADVLRDRAVLRAPELRDSRQLTLGDDAAAVIGDRIYVMGNPLGMNGTFSDGLVSARRPVDGTAMLQISAPISPGSSGGPVMNERGEVIGVAAMMVVGGQNISLAVPTRYLRPLLAVHQVARPFSAGVLPRRERLAGYTAPAPESPAGGGIWLQQVLARIALADSVLRRSGLQAAAPVRIGAAREGERGTVQFLLEAGTRYVAVARCDDDCTDVDLRLMDQAGRVLGNDAADDHNPAVSFLTTEAGEYRVEVAMTRCAVEPCAYGVAIYRTEMPRVSARGEKR